MTLLIDGYNNPAKFHLHPIWNNTDLGLFWRESHTRRTRRWIAIWDQSVIQNTVKTTTSAVYIRLIQIWNETQKASCSSFSLLSYSNLYLHLSVLDRTADVICYPCHTKWLAEELVFTYQQMIESINDQIRTPKKMVIVHAQPQFIYLFFNLRKNKKKLSQLCFLG